MKLINSVIKRLEYWLRQRGYYVYKPQKINGAVEFEIGNYSYGINMPNANYAPWLNDNLFREVYAKVRDNTLVDIHRCYELWMLVDEAMKISVDLNFIEIGVWRGGTAALIANKMATHQGKGKLYLADTFSGVVKTGIEDSYYTGGEHKDTTKEEVKKLLTSLSLDSYEILEGVFPEETSHFIPHDARFILCHIDVDVYLSAKDCLEWVWSKMPIGGIVILDDFGFHRTDGVTRLGEEQRQFKDRIFIHNLNGHGIIIKIA